MTNSEKTEAQLKSVALSGNVANAYILYGGTREERLRIAEDFAKILINSPADLIRPQHEKPNLFSVDDVRHEINETVYIKPYGSGKKVYIVDEAEKMNVQAQNALLKTLEEPPVYVTILLLSTHRECFLQTILSRAVKLSLQMLEEEVIESAPIQGLLRLGSRMKAENVQAFIKEQGKNKESRSDFLEYVRLWFKDVLVFKTENDTKNLDLKSELSPIRDYAERCSFVGINRILAQIQKTIDDLAANVNFELSVTTLFDEIRKEMEGKR